MPISAVNVTVSVDDAYILGQTQGSLEYTEDVLELAKKGASKWGETLQGLREWNVTNTAIFQESTSDNPVGADGEVSLQIDSTLWEGLTSVEAEFTNGLTQRGELEDPLWRSVRVAEKEMEISVTGDYEDPNSNAGGALSSLYTAQDNGDKVPFTLDFGELTFSGELHPGDWAIDTQERGDDVQIDFTLMHSGAITRDSGSLDTGQEVILASWFDESLVAVDVEHIDGDPVTSDPVDGSTYYEGNTIVETVTLTAERAEDLALEFSLAGDGALHDTVFTAP